MLRKFCAVLSFAMLLALPVRAVETVPAATPTATANVPGNSSGKLDVKRKSGKRSASKHHRKLSAPATAKARRAETKKPGQNATRMASSSAPGHRNNPKSKKTKSAAVKSQHAKHRAAPEHTGSVAPRSVPTPGLY